MDAFLPVAQAHRFLRPIARAGLFCGALVLILSTASFSHSTAFLSPVTNELRRSGVLGSALASLLLATAGLALSYMLVWARTRLDKGAELPLVSHLAGWPQAVALLPFIAAALSALYYFRPQPGFLPAGLDAQCAFLIGGVSIGLAFPLLVCERVFDAIPHEQLPEGQDLKALLFLSTLVFLGQGLIEIGAGLRLSWLYTAMAGIDYVLMAVAAELLLRTLPVWFMPPPDANAARGATTSLLASLLRPGSFSLSTFGQTIKDRFGMDFSRSWAIAYAREAFLPVLVGLLLFSWFLSGVVSVGLDTRGSYERLGAPAEILQPGLHLILPWPLGMVRRVEYGAVHSLSISSLGQQSGTIEKTPLPIDISRAEEDPPSSANRLWDQGQGSDTPYIIASNSSGRESFEVASVNLQILYRIGMDDVSARDAIYRAADPKELVETTSGWLLARFFATKTLSSLMGEDRQSLTRSLRMQLQQALDHLESGVEILDVVVESLRPPSGAAVAYHDVQAGAIVAATNIAAERGRAETTVGLAREDAAQTTKKSQAIAAELMSAADVELARFTADALSYKAAGHAFLLERYLSDLRAALSTSSLEIIDHRLGNPDAPVLDLRGHLGLTENLTGSERQPP